MNKNNPTNYDNDIALNNYMNLKDDENSRIKDLQEQIDQAGHADQADQMMTVELDDFDMIMDSVSQYLKEDYFKLPFYSPKIPRKPITSQQLFLDDFSITGSSSYLQNIRYLNNIWKMIKKHLFVFFSHLLTIYC